MAICAGFVDDGVFRGAVNHETPCVGIVAVESSLCDIGLGRVLRYYYTEGCVTTVRLLVCAGSRVGLAVEGNGLAGAEREMLFYHLFCLSRDGQIKAEYNLVAVSLALHVLVLALCIITCSVPFKVVTAAYCCRRVNCIHMVRSQYQSNDTVAPEGTRHHRVNGHRGRVLFACHIPCEFLALIAAENLCGDRRFGNV